MQNINAERQDSVTVHGESASQNQSHSNGSHDGNSNLGNQANNSTMSEREPAPKLETHLRKHGFSWASAEKIDGIIDPKQHVDWVMMTYYGFSLEYLINFVHNLSDQVHCPYKAFEAVMAQFGLDEMHADIVSESLFGEPFYALITDIHGWISDYEPEEDDGWSSSKPGMHDYLVWVVMEALAFGKMDEVNPNPD